MGAKSILDGPLVFVDIETNGLDHIRGKVIEVAAIRVEGGVIKDTYTSLLNPGTPIPYYITNLTGITSNDVVGAPAFQHIARDLALIMEGAVFVAHNVRFDYSFLKQEFGRIGMVFAPKQLCTVKLSRALHPHERGHKLSDLISRYNFSYSARHRAYDDAAVLWQFMQYVQKQFPPEQVAVAIAKQLKSPAIPKDLEPELVRNLPETAGVYIFEDEAGRPLYVGKSVNIKKRVMSHFGRDHAETKEFKIAQMIKHIRTEETAGELSALLLESRLVKELQPLYNRRLRKTNKLTLAKLVADNEGYNVVQLYEAATIDPDEMATIIAVYPRRSQARQNIEATTKIFGLCPKLMGVEKANGACFARQLGKCKGACVGAETSVEYNARVAVAFERQRMRAWPYKGAVLVQEQSASDNSGIVVDKWCVIASVRQAEYCDPVVEAYNAEFDLDTYKILQSYLAGKLKKLIIQRVDLNELLALA